MVARTGHTAVAAAALAVVAAVAVAAAGRGWRHSHTCPLLQRVLLLGVLLWQGLGAGPADSCKGKEHGISE